MPATHTACGQKHDPFTPCPCTGYVNDSDRCDRTDTRPCDLCHEARCPDHALARESMGAYICGGMRHW